MEECKEYDLRGYSPDFYLCLRERLDEGKDCEESIAICEVLYG